MSNITKNQRKPSIAQPLYIKVNALKELKNGIHESVIANNLNVHVNTVKKWKQKQEKILELETLVDGVIQKKKKRIKKPKNEALDNAVWEWFKEKRKTGDAIDGTLIKIQALAFHQALGGVNEKFTASNGWLDKFKKRYHICAQTIAGEKSLLNATSTDTFIPFFTDYIQKENLSEHQIFHCSEVGINIKSMPEAVLKIKEEDLIDDFKPERERLTLMVCSNASGFLKLPPVVIGKSTKPDFKKTIRISDTFPVYYQKEDFALMNNKLFSEWFDVKFIPKVIQFLNLMKLPFKAILLIDNCPFHPRKILQEDDIKTFFLPPDTTTLIQPMDQGILQCIKSKYRQKMMQHISDCLKNGQEIGECIEEINLEQVIYWITDSWNEVPNSCITRAWKPLWPDVMKHQAELTKSNDFVVNHALISKFFTMLQSTPGYQGLSYEDFKNWLYPSTVMTSDEALTYEEILQAVQDDEEDDKVNNDVENDDYRPSSNITSREDAKDALDKIIRFCQGEPSIFFAEKLPHLYQLEIAIDKNDTSVMDCDQELNIKVENG